MIAWEPATAWWGALGWVLFSGLMAVLFRTRRKRLLRLAEKEAWPALWPRGESPRRRIRPALRMTALALILLALARPRWGERWEHIERSGLDVMVALDVSRSMWAEDLKPSRLQHATWGVTDLLTHLRGDRLGLVMFAGEAEVLCPLTTDHNAFRLMLDDARPDRIARGGTHIERGLRAAMDALGPPGEADRVIVLISDGEKLEGDPSRLSTELREREIRLYAVGVGNPEGAPIPMPAEPGGTGGFLRDRDQRPVHTRLNEPLLRRLAQQTGGAYVRATPADFGLERLYREAMSDLRRGPHDIRQRRLLQERFPLFLAAALVCLAMEFGLSGMGLSPWAFLKKNSRKRVL